MLKKISIIILIVLSNLVLSQNLNKLDQNNGFKNFKLGTSLQYFKNSYELINSKDNKYIIYNPNESVFHFSIELIVLYFDDDDNLYQIAILPKTDDENTQIGALGKYFKKLYGKNTEGGSLNNNNDGNAYEQWSGNKVTLIVTYLFDGKKSIWIPVIKVIDNDYIDDGF